MRTLLVLSILCLFCPFASNAQDSKASPSPGHMTITGEVVIRIIVKNGHILDATCVKGSPILGKAAADWVKKNWKFSSDQTGTFTLPVTFHLNPKTGELKKERSND